MKILFVRQTWNHISTKSGYDNLFKEFEGKNYKHCFIRDRRIYQIFNKVLYTLFPKIRNYFSLTLLATELKIILIILFFRPSIIHFTHLQHKLFFLKIKLFSNKIKYAVTLHLPFSYWKTKIQTWDNFPIMDKIIVLDQKSKDYFIENTNLTEKIVFVPHAVDQAFFFPSSDKNPKKSKFQCLFVGRFFRDIDTLISIIFDIHDNHKNIDFHVIYPVNRNTTNQFYKLISAIGLPNVFHYKYLSDKDLRNLYQTCDVLLQPLIDSTANNAILEAISCGLPVIASNRGGVRTYVQIPFLICNSNKPSEFVEKILDLKNDETLRTEISTELVQKSKIFSLQKVKAQLLEVFKDIVNPQ